MLARATVASSCGSSSFSRANQNGPRLTACGTVASRVRTNVQRRGDEAAERRLNAVEAPLLIR
jgi:hypothetical protein